MASYLRPPDRVGSYTLAFLLTHIPPIGLPATGGHVSMHCAQEPLLWRFIPNKVSFSLSLARALSLPPSLPRLPQAPGGRRHVLWGALLLKSS